jgi:hypothetical protein
MWKSISPSIDGISAIFGMEEGVSKERRIRKL